MQASFLEGIKSTSVHNRAILHILQHVDLCIMYTSNSADEMDTVQYVHILVAATLLVHASADSGFVTTVHASTCLDNCTKDSASFMPVFDH